MIRRFMLLIAILSYGSWEARPCCAYNVELEISSGTATLDQKLQEYESTILTRAAALCGSKKRSDTARCIVNVSQDGVVTKAEVTGGSDDGFGKKLKAEKFAKVPIQSGSSVLKLDFSFAELLSPPYRRENIFISGDSLVFGEGGFTAPISKSNTLPRPYNEDDRIFDKEIVALYSQLPLSMLGTRLQSHRSAASEEQLQSEFMQFKKQANWPSMCNTILLILKKSVEGSELAKVKEWLQLLEDTSARLNQEGKCSVVLGLIELASSFHRSDTVVGRELVLRQAETLMNRDSIEQPSIRLQLARALAHHYQRANNRELERKANIDVLKYSLAVEPVDARAVIRSYQTVVRDQMSMCDRSAANATLDQYRAFVEKSFGAESLELIPVMVSSLRIAPDAENRVKLLADISKLVNSYRPIPKFSVVGIRLDESGRSAISALRVDPFFRGAGCETLRDEEVLTLARLAYKLQLKTAGFDYSIFSNLCKVLDSQGRYEQAVTLCRETAEFLLSMGGDNDTGGHLSSLRRSYASALKKIGANETTDSVMKLLNEAEDERAMAAMKRAESRIAELEKQPVNDVMRLVNARVSFIQLYRGDDDKPIVAQLERMQQELSKAPADQIRSGFEVSLLHRISSNKRLVTEHVFEKPLVDLFCTIDDRIPGGISPSTIRSLTKPRFGKPANSNLTAVMKALAERGRAVGR